MEANHAIKINNYVLNIFISQPMTGLSNEEILAHRNLAISKLDKISEQYSKFHPSEYIEFNYIDNTQFNEEKTPLGYMAKDVELIDKADIVYFADGWEKSRGCNVEYTICKEYGKEMIFGYNVAIVTEALHTYIDKNKIN